MIGKVDDRNRALIDLEVRRTPNSQGTSVTAWIDTAFDGHLVFPLSLIQVIAKDGKLPLLGTGLLENHVLHVDYVNKELTID